MADADPGLLARILGRAAYEFAELQPMLPTYLHLIASALFPIYAGAHASLSRPASAAKPTKRKHRRTSSRGSNLSDDDADDDDDDEDDQDEEHVMEGLSPRDALLMPLFAGTALASLYFLLKWMKDPALLNKILNAYFGIFGVFSVARLVTDMLDLGHSLIYPRRHVVAGALYHVSGPDEKAVAVAGNTNNAQPIVSPLPGFLAALPLPDRVRKMLWADRAMPANKWTLRLYMHRLAAGKLKIGPHGIVGILVGLSTVAYFNLVDKPWYLTNLLGFGFSYGALQLMSPTTFATGSLILSALFFYDIYFVFYTPMMVTVAKSLDVPIKLMFPRPSAPGDPASVPSHAMLGLGDVVLPGIVIGLALRFDLYLFYLRRQKTTPATATSPEKIEKPQYFPLAGRWSDHFWTHSLTGRPLWTSSREALSKPEAPFTFPKTYFKASLVGYVLGLLATLGVMIVWNHAQPALLYLVPGVLGSIWLTALVRGELSLMWNYTEEVEEEAEDKKNTDDQTKGPDAKTSTESQSEGIATISDAKVNPSSKRTTGHRGDREFFSFSIQAPWPLKSPRSPASSSRTDMADAATQPASTQHNWVPAKPTSPAQVAATEPPGKRLRLK